MFRSGKCTPVNWTSFYVTGHLSLPPCELMEIVDSVGRPSDVMWVYTGYRARKCLHTGTVKIDLHIFSILNTHVTVISKRFIKNTYLYAVKQKLKIAVLASVRKSYISKFVLK